MYSEKFLPPNACNLLTIVFILVVMTPAKLLLLLCFHGISLFCMAQPIARYEVVIDEIMADPTPQVGLPNAEFIELKNVSGRDLNLAGCRLSTSSATSGAFPNYVLPADDFLIITSTGNATLFSSFGRVLGIPSFPSLANDGTLLSLTSKEGLTIHAVNYSSSWYQNAVKQEGGWTLEMIDTKNPCGGLSNWKASTDPGGGTPGKKNAVDGANPDQTPPQLQRTYSIDSVTLVAVFDEPLDSASASVVTNYSLTHGIRLVSVVAQAPLFNQVVLRLSTPLEKRTVYTLTANHVKDCQGNAIAAYNQARAGLTEEALDTDIVINEILFNPRPNAFDYVELYNKSNKVLDGSRLYIANRNAAGAISSAKKLSESPYWIFPGEHIVVTEDAASLMKEYLVQTPSNTLALSSLPSYPDDKGTVVITNSQGEVVDEVRYSSKWHFALISNAEGVALERIDPAGTSQDAGNWHSAAFTAGFGTPTYQNSQHKLAEAGNAVIDIRPKIFSPDNDGYDDMLTIQYQMEEAGYMANITIFNAGGKAVRYFVKNQTLGLKGSWNWDGLDEKTQKLPAGTYIIYTEVFNLQGKKQQFKKAVVLARRLSEP